MRTSFYKWMTQKAKEGMGDEDSDALLLRHLNKARNDSRFPRSATKRSSILQYLEDVGTEIQEVAHWQCLLNQYDGRFENEPVPEAEQVESVERLLYIENRAKAVVTAYLKELGYEFMHVLYIEACGPVGCDLLEDGFLDVNFVYIRNHKSHRDYVGIPYKVLFGSSDDLDKWAKSAARQKKAERILV